MNLDLQRVNELDTYTGGISNEAKEQFANCLHAFTNYREQAATAISLMVLSFGEMHELIGEENFNRLCKDVFNISKSKKYRWLNAYYQGKQKLIDVNGNFDKSLFKRLSLSGIKLLQESDETIIAEIKEHNPGDMPIPDAEVKRILTEKLEAERAAKEKAIAEKDEAKRDANREREATDKMQATLTNERALMNLEMSKLEKHLNQVLNDYNNATDEVSRLKQEITDLKSKPPKTVKVYEEIIPEPYASLQEAIRESKRKLEEVQQQVDENEGKKLELDQDIESLRIKIETMTVEKNSFESLFAALDSLVANWPHTLLQNVDSNNTHLVARLKTYADALDGLIAQLRR